MKVKITTSDAKNIVLVKQWPQLKILEETGNSISVEGYAKLIDMVVLELYWRQRRHPEAIYEAEYIG